MQLGDGWQLCNFLGTVFLARFVPIPPVEVLPGLVLTQAQASCVPVPCRCRQCNPLWPFSQN